jgi:gluconolactonase
MPEQVQLDVRDRRLLDLIDTQAGLQRLETGFGFTEGPVWDKAGSSLVFSDIVGNTQYRWTPGGTTVLRRPSNMANGNTLDRQGRLLSCEHATSRVVRAERDGSVTMLASHYDGRELNSPNDIVVRSDDTIWFTDPTSGRSARWGVEREPELPFRGVYRLDRDGGEPVLLVDDFAKPNGLCFSLHERRLFVNDTDRAHIRVFNVQDDATLAGGEVWAELDGSGEGVADGMKIDAGGNLFCTGPGGIHVFDLNARCLGVIRMPEKTANLAWGGLDFLTLFVTASTSLYSLRTHIPGH